MSSGRSGSRRSSRAAAVVAGVAATTVEATGVTTVEATGAITVEIEIAAAIPEVGEMGAGAGSRPPLTTKALPLLSVARLFQGEEVVAAVEGHLLPEVASKEAATRLFPLRPSLPQCLLVGSAMMSPPSARIS